MIHVSQLILHSDFEWRLPSAIFLTMFHSLALHIEMQARYTFFYVFRGIFSSSLQSNSFAKLLHAKCFSAAFQNTHPKLTLKTVKFVVQRPVLKTGVHSLINHLNLTSHLCMLISFGCNGVER